MLSLKSGAYLAALSGQAPTEFVPGVRSFCLEVHLLSNKVLVADDDPSFCDLLQEMLRAAEMEAHGTTDSKKAVAWLMKEKFDAVFLDMHMPAPDGIEVIRQMRASGFNRPTPIIVITGEEDRGFMARAFHAGAT